MGKNKVLILNPYYEPGYRYGGPQQTVKNICDAYRKDSNIYIIAKNHDYGVDDEYNISTGCWVNHDGIKIKYLIDRQYNYRTFVRAYNSFDRIYACGLFCDCTYLTMLIHRLHKAHNERKILYVAPMGVFSRGALDIKRAKKMLFLKLAMKFGLFQDIIWSFSSKIEYADALGVLGCQHILHYIIAEDLPRRVEFDKYRSFFKTKEKGHLNAVFISRISRMKNLLDCARILEGDYIGTVDFNIYGVIEDKGYWEECKEAFKRLAPNVIVRYCGKVHPSEVTDIFSMHDLFLFPTFGENFGHVIYESLASGCVPVISNTTPWMNLREKQCGAVVPIGDILSFQRVIQSFIDMDMLEFETFKSNAIDYAEEKYKKSLKNSGYDNVFLGTEEIL